MKILLLSIITIAGFCSSFSQQKDYAIHSKALGIGIYDAKKRVKNNYKVFYAEEAEREFEKVLQTDNKLRKLFISEISDENGNILYIREREIYEYYPELGIIIEGGGHGYISAFDIIKKKEVYGNPSTYAYSPSRKYRFSGLNKDGMHYYLEEKINEEYVLIGNIYFDGIVDGFYWIDDETIYYLKEKIKANGSKYWIAYSGQFYPITSP